MGLTSLELHNFKLYRGTVTVDFGDAAFTSIIGPNGAGKSNMMDAISFVLGVQSAQLRSHDLKDLIYRGRVLGPENTEADPQSAYVAATYLKKDGSTLHLKRTISSASSEYKINNRNVTALQYAMALKAESILIKARNFLVFQGDIENVASQLPRDLTKLFETISGLAACAKEYAELKELHEQAQEVSTAVMARKRNLNTESKQYKEQMKERALFETKLTEKSRLIKVSHLYRIYHNEQKHMRLQGELESATASAQKIALSLEDEEQQYSEHVSKHAQQALKVATLDNSIDTLNSVLAAKKRSMVPLTSEKKALTGKVAFTQRKIEDLAADIDRQASIDAALHEKLNLTSASLSESVQHLEELKQRVNIPEKGVKEYAQLRSEFLASGGAELEEQLSAKESSKGAITSKLTNSRNTEEELEMRISDLEADIKVNFALKLDDLTLRLREVLELQSQKTEEKELLLRKQHAAATKELEYNKELKEVVTKLDELSADKKESKKQRKLRENMAMLRGLVKEGSIKGFMFELVKASQHKYKTALLTLLGGNYDAIVVDNASVAQRCIEILKERRAGSATFIPLDSVVCHPINLNFLRSLHPQARPAIDAVKFDDLVERAVQFVVGDAIIVDDIDVGRDLKWNSTQTLSNKFVSLDGALIHKSGLMTGGQPREDRWSRDELAHMKKRKDELVELLKDVAREKPSIIEINSLTEECGRLSEEVSPLKNQISTVERHIQERKSEIDFCKGKIEVAQETVQQMEAALSEVNKLILGVLLSVMSKQSLYDDFCKRYKLQSISDYEDLFGAALRAKEREHTELRKQIASLKSRIDFSTSKIAETRERRSRMEKELVSFDAKLLNLQVKLAEKQEEITEIQEKLLEATNERGEQIEILSSISRIVTDHDSRKEDLASDLKLLQREVLHLQESLTRIDTERFHMLKNCKIENVELPLEDGLLEEISLDDQDPNNAYKVKIDYDLLDNLFRTTYNPRVEAETKAKITAIDDELQALTPNAKAMERLKEVDQKLREFDREFTRARQNEKKTSERFNEIKNQRLSLFMTAFTQVSSKIDGIYKELTISPNAPLGGSAYLTLEDEEAPYLGGVKYHAMPPMKRFRDMELLSGGEKLIAALALLFALHTINPSPFFVLDEVDAALDNANVSRIAKYIQKRASPEFQFIVISLKSNLFETSDSLVGIYREQTENSSRTVTLDLREYDA